MSYASASALCSFPPTPSTPVTSKPIAMERSSLFLLAILLLAVSPLPTTAAFVQCDGYGLYAANSTYEANLRRLAAIFPAEASLRYVYRAIGYWPNRLRATSSCFIESSSDCAACVAGAFREAERACPYDKNVVVFNQNCTLRFADFTTFKGNHVFGPSIFEILAPAMALQAIGFGWLFFLLLQEWRDKRRGSMMRDSSLPSEDQ